MQIEKVQTETHLEFTITTPEGKVGVVSIDNMLVNLMGEEWAEAQALKGIK